VATAASNPSTSGRSARKRRAAQVDSTAETPFISGPSALLPSLSLVNDPYLQSLPSLAATPTFPTDAIADLSGLSVQPHPHSHSHPPEKRPRKQPRRKYDFDLIKLAIIRYEEVHGNLHIARDFIVPMGSPDWPGRVISASVVRSLRFTYLCFSLYSFRLSAYLSCHVMSCHVMLALISYALTLFP
jgi:hypothetical protein